MTIPLEELNTDYREFDHSLLPFPLSNRLLTPELIIEKKGDHFSLALGAQVRKSGKTSFKQCISLNHNWLFDGSRIKPLPFDIPNILVEELSGIEPDQLKFADVISLLRMNIEGVNIAVSPEVLAKADVDSKEMSLSGAIEGLHAELYPYQEQGVAWMQNALEQFGGALLCDEMGLGKTLQIIALLLIKKPSNKSPALIVCPTTLIANWSREIQRFAPELTILIHRGNDRTGFYKDLMRAQVVITTYETLVRDISMMRGVKFSFVICDEAQAVKNPDSKRRKLLSSIPRHYTIPVTGTPVENSLLDLWSLVDLVIPDLLDDKDSFLAAYPDSEESAENLSVITDPLVLKRQVKDVAGDLPERIDIDMPIELSEEGVNEYERIRAAAVEEYGMAGQLVAVGLLAMYCAHPSLRAKNLSHQDWESEVEVSEEVKSQLKTPKIELCIQILREAFLTNKKVLIFATYNNCGDLIRKALLAEKIVPDYWNSINGSTPQDERQGIVDEFTTATGSSVLVLNPKAAGAGLNITAATVVIHYTQNWNPALEMQASARAHRRGQENPVTIYRLYYQGTVEELMVERSSWKRELGNIAVPIGTRDKEDFAKALGI